MLSKRSLLLAGLACAAAALAPAALAQEAATVTGRVTDTRGAPVAGAVVRIAELNVGAATSQDGTFRLVVPGSRIASGRTVQVTAQRVGLALQTHSLSLSPGVVATVNFQLATQALGLDELVVER